MFRRVRVPTRRFADYRTLVRPALYAQVEDLAQRLRGLRILQVNSTSQGGGVAEILRSETALLRDLGVDAEWQVATAPPRFFEITKAIHNGMQGGPVELEANEWDFYEEHNRRLASHLEAARWDLIVVHDPQPCPLPSFAADAGSTRWVWRCHIDLSHANPHYARRIQSYLRPYDATVFSHHAYVLPETRNAHIITPAIDPLTAKNERLTAAQARRIVASFGIDLSKPLVTQVSRFDAWKDPLGVIEAWKIARERVPDLQLALVGQYADDDPEGETILTQIRGAANRQPGFFLVANQADDRDVHAFQTVSRVVLQKSLREGFGLTVSEALWAGTPVIGGAVGGIPTQVTDGRNGYLVETVEDAAQRIVEIVEDPKLRARLGAAGRERVRRRFLLPRLLRDDLRLWNRLVAPARPRRRHDVERGAPARIRPARRLAHPRPIRIRAAGGLP